MGFMKVSHAIIYILLLSFILTPFAELIIESNVTANITEKVVWSEAISPDGSTIAYVAYDTSRIQQIFTVKIDGTDKRQITNDLNRKWGIEWWTDEISFLSYDKDDIEKIFVVSQDGSARRKLINETIRQGREPIKRDRLWGGGSWNPDKKRILFTSLGKKGDEKIFQVNIDGTELKQVIDDDSRQWNPQWSPDGNSFVYVSQDTRNLDQLYIANADGTGKKQITDDGFKKYDLNWGKYGILFKSTETELASSEKIFIINPDGTGKRRLVEDGFNQDNPRWSRDGSTILYEDIDIKGNLMIRILNLQKEIITPTVTPTVKKTIVSTPVQVETPVPKPGKSNYIVPVLGIIVLVVAAILVYLNFQSKKK